MLAKCRNESGKLIISYGRSQEYVSYTVGLGVAMDSWKSGLFLNIYMKTLKGTCSY